METNPMNGRLGYWIFMVDTLGLFMSFYFVYFCWFLFCSLIHSTPQQPPLDLIRAWGVPKDSVRALTSSPESKAP